MFNEFHNLMVQYGRKKNKSNLTLANRKLIDYNELFNLVVKVFIIKKKIILYFMIYLLKLYLSSRHHQCNHLFQALDSHLLTHTSYYYLYIFCTLLNILSS